MRSLIIFLRSPSPAPSPPAPSPPLLLPPPLLPPPLLPPPLLPPPLPSLPSPPLLLPPPLLPINKLLSVQTVAFIEAAQALSVVLRRIANVQLASGIRYELPWVSSVGESSLPPSTAHPHPHTHLTLDAFMVGNL